MTILQRAFKVDLALFEADTMLQDGINQWTGRLLMMNILALTHMNISMDKALGFVLASQKIATLLLQSLDVENTGLVESDHLDFLL